MQNNSGDIIKHYYCRYGCGTLIHFEDNVISSNGRKVPLEGDNTPHNCPFSLYNQKKNCSSNLNDLEVIENAKILFLNTLNRRREDILNGNGSSDVSTTTTKNFLKNVRKDLSKLVKKYDGEVT